MNTVVCPLQEDVRRLRAGTFAAMSRSLGSHIVDAAQRCAARLLAALPSQVLYKNRVFVAYGGGKDSSYTFAFVRLMQLFLFEEHETTFQLVAATNRHVGMPDAVLENIDRVYRAVGAYEDPDVELLLIDGDRICPFDPASPLRAETIEKNRLDILMTGHRCEGNARPTFCNACNLSMVNSFCLAASYGDGVDVVITGDSNKEQKAYFAWVHQIARKFDLPVARGDRSFRAFLQTLGNISSSYFQNIYGNEVNQELRSFNTDHLLRIPVFFSIYQDTVYAAGQHWEFLTDFLGFQFDEMAFSFTESDCSHPALMAHLRGLKAEHLYQRTYQEGIIEYIHFALELMQKKDFPSHLIELMQQRYDTPSAIQAMRSKLDRYAQKILDLNQEQLVCMLYSPFIQQGKNLATYLEREQPDLCEHIEAIHSLLSSSEPLNETPETQKLALRLRAISHLSIEQLRSLYTTVLANRVENMISVVLSRDPHKKTIWTTKSPYGPSMSEVISGR